MKKFIYSGYTKLAAAILLIICTAAGTLILTDGFADYFDEQDNIYGFENSFSESSYIKSVLNSVESVIYHTYISFYDENEKKASVSDMSFEEYLQKKLDNLYCSDKINYFVSINDKVYTNCGAASADELRNSQIYKYALRDGNGNTEYESPTAYHRPDSLMYIDEFNKTDVITMCVSIKDSYAAEYESAWKYQEELFRAVFIEIVIAVVLALLLLIYLICAAGRTKDGGLKKIWIDSVITEIHFAVAALAGLAALAACITLLDGYQDRNLPLYMVRIGTVFSAALGTAAVLNSALSIIRKIKLGSFIETSIICLIVKWTWRTLVRLLKWLRLKIRSFRNTVSSSGKPGAILISMLFIYTAVIGICGIFTPNTPFFLFAGIALFAFAAAAAAHRARDIDGVSRGAEEIRSGNLQYKIPEPKSEDMKKIAENINEIGDGLEKSVSARMKAERLKTELITNVSHDLKTPLTSIISYTELLSAMEELPEEAKDYIRIISKKSERLKNLTRDLFEVSKVQSGNEVINFEKLDAATLVNQALGEHDNEIKKSELTFRVDTGKDLFITADGRKMSRVLGNLIDNALKYSMKNTRVFISAYEKDNKVITEIKNISGYPMDFDAEEITGRFVRGDKSRTDGGSGLGLAIAKSYTEACNGSFDIVVDGDLFKAVISFDKAL